MAERTLEERAAEAALNGVEGGGFCTRCGGALFDSHGHANTCPSVVIPELLAEVKRLQEINSQHCHDYNVILLDNSKLSARLKDAETIVEALGVMLKVQRGGTAMYLTTDFEDSEWPDAIAAFKRLRGIAEPQPVFRGFDPAHEGEDHSR